ncbi:MAG TPA: four helix bundle protein [Phycisphaerae bacterium]|nr:four helix bundle protein [Phycisphaerae bacterium]
MGVVMAIRDYKDLIAWQKGMDLVEAVYRFSKSLPADERFGLVSQVRRSAVSIPANVAEGFGRSTRAEYARFLDIALGSANEVETHLLVSGRLGYANGNNLEAVLELTGEIQRILKGLIRTVANSDKSSVRTQREDQSR